MADLQLLQEEQAGQQVVPLCWTYPAWTQGLFEMPLLQEPA